MDAKTRREQQKADTRSDLIRAAHKLVQKDGYDGLTIRNLAKATGYAPMSVYSYFADKQEILTALAQDAFESLAAKLRANRPDDPIEALRAMLRDYAAFGLDNPNEYRTIFMTEKVHDHEDEEIERLEKENPALAILYERVGACIAAGRLRGDVEAIGTVLWTAAHGAISLLITFPHKMFGDPQAYLEMTGDVLLAGLQQEIVKPLEGKQPACL